MTLSALNVELAGLGMELDTSRFSTDGYVGIASLVPEPGRALLVMLGVGVMVMRRRREVYLGWLGQYDGKR